MTDMHKAINWMAIIFLLPATIFMVYGMIKEKMRRNKIPHEILLVGCLYASIWVSLIRNNAGKGTGWINWSLLVIQFILIVLLFKKLWGSKKIFPTSDKG